jgi:hypothetical protein
VSGTDAVGGLLQKLGHSYALNVLLRRTLTAGVRDIDLMEAFRQRAMQTSELDALWTDRQNQEAATRLDVSHPPLTYRLELLHANRIAGSKVTLSAEDSAALAAELAPLRMKIQKQLLLEV